MPRTRTKRDLLYFVFSAVLATSSILSGASSADSKEVRCPAGVNVNSFQNFDADKQEAIVRQLKESKVEFVRTSFRLDEKDLALMKKLQSEDIGVVLVVGLKYPPGVKERPANSQYKMRAAMPLSQCDIQLTGKSYQEIFEKLDQNGLKLTALELGNELNWTDFNGDFPVPSLGKAFTKKDLENDPLGKKIAKGFLQYIKALRVLKEARSASQLNKETPIISCGMVGSTGGDWQKRAKVDGVTMQATYSFLREHGLDDLVDGYGVHTYPGVVKAGDKKALEERNAKLDEEIFPKGNTKPYWVTEWGFHTKSLTDDDDKERTRSVVEMRTYFHELQGQGRLGGIFWYVWNEPDLCSIYRNGHLTEAGNRATRHM